MNKKICSLLLVLSIAASSNAQMQNGNTCSQAKETPGIPDSCTVNEHQLNAGEMEQWHRIMPAEQELKVRVEKPLDENLEEAHIHKIKLYKGGCGGLMLIEEKDIALNEELKIERTDIAVNEEHFIKLERDPNCGQCSAQGGAFYGLCVQSVLLPAGSYHSLFLCSDGTVQASGSNTTGELGIGSLIPDNISTPTQVISLNNVIDVDAGSRHSLALKNDGTVWAWGLNNIGQLGDGSNTSTTTPVQVIGLNGIIAIAAGDFHSVALKNDGTVWAWGYNVYGQLGDGSTINKNIPVQVSGIAGIIGIAAGLQTLALKNDGTVWAWGYGASGMLGNGATANQTTPIQVLAGTSGCATYLCDIVAVSAGSLYSFAIRNDGTVWAWGSNSNGQLGDGSLVDKYTPVEIVGLSNIITVSAGQGHTLALEDGGAVWAWGANNNGQLGDGTTIDKNTPIKVLSGTSGCGAFLCNIVDISAGLGGHSIAIKNDGTAWAWGYNNYGQLGNGNTTDQMNPVQVNVSCTLAICKPLYAFISPNTTICTGQSANLSVIISGTAPPYTYIWDPSESLNNSNIPNPIASPDVTTTYSITVTNAINCSTNAAVTVSTIQSPVVAVSPVSAILSCPNESVTITASGAGTYSWSPATGLNSTTGSTVIAGPTTTTAYTVIGTANNGCSSSAMVDVTASYCVPAGVTIDINLCNATATSTTTYSYKNILINGTYTISIPQNGGQVYFTGCAIYFGPNAKIIMPDDAYETLLQFNHSSLLSGCNYMWDGIYVEGINNTVSFSDGSDTRDAENVIVSENGGIFKFFAQNYFYDNHIFLKVKPYSGTHTGFIQGATIVTLNKLIQPRLNERTAIGVEITDVDDITIGVPGSAINIFQNIDVGIKCMNTSIATRNLTVQHNKFENIKAKICEATIGGKQCQPSPGIAVWVLGPNEDGTSGFSPSIEEYVTVGGASANQSNEFNWCGTGIKVEPMHQTTTPGQVIYTRANVTVERNKFTNIMPVATQISATAVFVRKLWSGNVTVKNHNSQDSYFRSVHTGVRIIDPIGQVEFTIENNNFNSLNSGDGSAAVIIANAFPMAMAMASTVQVKNNLIQKMNAGILIRNVIMMDDPVKIYDNTILMNQSITSSSPVRYGILSEKSNALIENNTIKRTSSAPGASVAHKLRGIQISNSQSAIVMNNKLQKMGNGIYCKDNNNNSQLECNIFGISGVNNSGCVNGFVLDNATIGNQGVGFGGTTYPTDNQWFPANGTNLRFSGSSNTVIDWYYRGTYSQYSPTSNNVINIVFTALSSNLPYNCDIGCLNPPCKQKKLAGGVNNQTAYANYVQENKYMEKENIFAELRNNPSLMQLGTADDAVLQQFHDSVLLTNMGKIREVHEHVAAGNLLLAEQKNNSIVPENLMEDNHKKVNDVYLRTWAKAEFAFTDADKATLESVAYQKPIEGGKAVYTARVMLDILPDDEALMARMASPQEIEQEEPIVLKNGSYVTKLYPNPNDGNMQIDYHLDVEQEGEIIIYDFTGKIISSHTLLRENSSLQIKENLANGVYHYRIFVNKEIVSSEKLVIIR